jgi:hypothetical protein
MSLTWHSLEPIPFVVEEFMQVGIDEVIGKHITAVVVADSPESPRRQVFLIFADDTNFELYESDGVFSWASAVDRGGIEKARAYIAQFPEARIKAEYFHPDER